jgi:regulator of replication initiation timing
MTQTIDVLEAARRLGITPDAVRARLRRGSIEGYRDNTGSWRIVSNDTIGDTMLEPPRHDTDTTRHDGVSPELARLMMAFMERMEADQARLTEERDRLRDELQEARADADQAKADQARMAQEVTAMFQELRSLAERHAELHADRGRLEAQIAAVVKHRARLEMDVAGLKSELNQECTRSADLKAEAQHQAHEINRLSADLEQARRPWWQGLVGR